MYCSLIDQFENLFKDNSSSIRRFSCSNHLFIQIFRYLSRNDHLETISILGCSKDLLWPIENMNLKSKLIEVEDEQHLIRHLFFKKLNHLIEEGLRFQ